MLDVEIFPQPDGKNHNKRGKHRVPQGGACSTSDNGSIVRARHQLSAEALFCASRDNKVSHKIGSILMIFLLENTAANYSTAAHKFWTQLLTPSHFEYLLFHLKCSQGLEIKTKCFPDTSVFFAIPPMPCVGFLLAVFLLQFIPRPGSASLTLLLHLKLFLSHGFLVLSC